MYLKCPQQILLKGTTKKSHCGSVLPQTLKELFEYMIGYIVITLQSVL